VRKKNVGLIASFTITEVRESHIYKWGFLFSGNKLYIHRFNVVNMILTILENILTIWLITLVNFFYQLFFVKYVFVSNFIEF